MVISDFWRTCLLLNMSKKERRDLKTISYNMSRIRSKDTSIEILLRKTLWKEGFRYRKNYKKLPGSPDIVFVKERIAIFCDGSFWHGYKFGQTKRHKFKSNQSFWIEKIKKNIERDKKINNKLKKDGWLVLRFWDFQIKNKLDHCVEKVKFYTNERS